MASLRWRLPLLICGVFVVVLAIIVGTAYREVEATLERGAGERARNAAQQVAGILVESTALTFTQLQRVAPSLRTFLTDPSAGNVVEARAALAAMAATPRRRITVWNSAGVRLLEIPDGPAAADPADPSVSGPTRMPAAGISPIQAEGDRAFVEATVAVPAPDGTAGTIGAVSVRTTLSITPADGLSRLIGDDARVLFGNADGPVWTDMSHVVPGPPLDRAATSYQRYRSPEGDDRIGAVSALIGTPWIVWVEFPRAPMVASARAFLERMAVFVLLVALGAVWLVRRLVTNVTTPLAAMTSAAEAMAAGDYSRRVADRRGDEIGRLGRAFNAMSDDVARELTERQRAHDQLRVSEGRYRTLFDYAPDGILIADAESRYIDANASMCRMLGYAREEVVGLHASDIVVPGEVEHITPALQAINAQADYHREWRFRRRDGSTFDADVIATQMPDGLLLGMVRDSTDRNTAIEAVRVAEERMRFALEGAGVGIWEVDYRTSVVRWSPILEAQYGLAPGTFEGTFEAFLARVHGDDRATVDATLRAAAIAGGDFSLQHRIVRPDGVVRRVTGVGQIYLDGGGEPRRGVGISLDVTERHTLEAQFQQAQKMEAVGRLAGGIAHDFNNLLTAILGYCELMLADLTPADPMRSEVLEVQRAGLRAADLTRQLLAFSRKQITEPTLLDVNGVVTGVQSMLSRLIGEDVAIVVALAPAPMVISADPGQAEQIIVNLAVNARDAMPRGGRLTIQTSLVDLDDDYAAVHLGVKPGAYVALTVTDTGTGMSPDVQAHLFEPFFTTKEPGRGTGLGLATVHGIVLGCGGSVGVYSEVGKGTSIKVYFPRVDAAVDAPHAAPVASAEPLGHAPTVLVVDDAEVLRELMRRTLERQGCRVLLAANATEALRHVEQHQVIDLLLTDVVMPGASGPELTLDLQRRRPDLKVIYMSGYTEDAIVHHGVLKPGIAFLHKPFTASALGQKIREVLMR